MVEVLTRF